MDEDDTAYFHRRAGIEMELARRAETPEAVRVHVTLANAYLQRIGEPAIVTDTADA